jgi:hypothetical protein
VVEDLVQLDHLDTGLLVGHRNICAPAAVLLIAMSGVGCAGTLSATEVANELIA